MLYVIRYTLYVDLLKPLKSQDRGWKAAPTVEFLSLVFLQSAIRNPQFAICPLSSANRLRIYYLPGLYCKLYIYPLRTRKRKWKVYFYHW